MLRKFIKSFIPSKGDTFFNLFEHSAINAKKSAQTLIDILDEKNANNLLMKPIKKS